MTDSELPAGFCDWLVTQANDPTDCDIIDRDDGRQSTVVKGRDDRIGDLGLSLRRHRESGGQDPQTVDELVGIAIDEREAHGVTVSDRHVERAICDAQGAFARFEKRGRR